MSNTETNGDELYNQFVKQTDMAEGSDAHTLISDDSPKLNYLAKLNESVASSKETLTEGTEFVGAQKQLEEAITRSINNSTASLVAEEEEVVSKMGNVDINEDTQPLNVFKPRVVKPLQETTNTHRSNKPIKFQVRKVSREPIQQPNATFNKRGGKEELPSHIRSYEKQYEQLNSKILKISKEISFLADLLPPNSMAQDLEQRKKLSSAKDKLAVKLEELEKEKYQIGIMVSRAWRKVQDGNDVTDFWVRSVSS